MNDAAQLELPEDGPETKVTTAAIMERLQSKYGRDEYAVFFDVGDAIGTKYRRRADAVAVGFWGSTGRLIEGFEIKQSRADWLREVKAVAKADPFLELVDKWWLVAPDGAAKAEELPACWGWMTATKHGLRVQRPATLLPNAGGKIDRLFALELFRKVSRDMLEAPEVRAALQKAYEVRERTITERVASELSRRQSDYDQMKQRIEQFEKASGMKLGDWHLGNVGSLARSIADLRDEGYGSAANRLEQQERTLELLLEQLRSARQALQHAAVAA